MFPFANKLHEQRRQRIGVEKLSYIDTDVYFTNGNPAPVGTPEEILAAGQKMYNELSPQTKEFFDFIDWRTNFLTCSEEKQSVRAAI